MVGGPAEGSNAGGNSTLLSATAVTSIVTASVGSGCDAGQNARLGMDAGERLIQHRISPECDLNGVGTEWHPPGWEAIGDEFPAASRQVAPAQLPSMALSSRITKNLVAED